MADKKGAPRIDRKLQYKQLIERGARIGETLENQHVLESFKNIMELIEICENVSTDYASAGNVENTSDYLMDASVIKMSHDLMINTAEKMSDNDFQEDEYVAALLQLMSSNEKDKLLDISASCCKTAQFQLSMLGTFSFEASVVPKEQKVKRERAVRSKLGVKKAPVNITQIQKVDKGAAKINMVRQEIERICKERRVHSIPYYELIIDPNSYMNTVDSAFQISFLVRDGVLGIKRVDKEPHVFLAKPDGRPTTSRNEEANTNTVQTIMPLSPPFFRKEIKKYQIKTALMNLKMEDEDGSDGEEENASDYSE